MDGDMGATLGSGGDGLDDCGDGVATPAIECSGVDKGDGAVLGIVTEYAVEDGEYDGEFGEKEGDFGEYDGDAGVEIVVGVVGVVGEYVGVVGVIGE